MTVHLISAEERRNS